MAAKTYGDYFSLNAD